MKYEFTGETKEVVTLSRKVILHRIKALVTLGFVKVGELGGWVEKEENLSQEGESWVCSNAMVCGDAEIWGNAKVCSNAMVYGDAKVCGNAKVWGDAEICGDAQVCGDAKVCGNAMVYGDAKVCGDAKVWGDAEIWGNAKVWGDAEIWGNAKVCGNAKVWGDAEIWGNAKVCGNAKVWGDAEICGDAKVCGDAEVFSLESMLTIAPVGASGHCATFFRTKDKMLMVSCSWFLGSLEGFKTSYIQGSDCNEKQEKIIKKACELAEKWIDLK